jgi:hypothetical protein
MEIRSTAKPGCLSNAGCALGGPVPLSLGLIAAAFITLSYMTLIDMNWQDLLPLASQCYSLR